MNQAETPAITTSSLFPNLKEEERRLAEENLDRYLVVVLRIYQRINSGKTLLSNSPVEGRVLRAESLINQRI